MTLAETLTRGRFLKLVEIRPPKGVVVDDLISVSKRLHGRCDAVVVPQNAGAIMALSAVPLARRIAETGHDVVLDISCRDSNRVALQSELLGAYLEGIRGVSVSRGTDPAYGDHPRARAVYDLEPHELLATIGGFSEGYDESGNPVEGRPKLVAGVEVDPWVADQSIDGEVTGAKKSIEAGASFLMTTAVHDAAAFAPLAERLAELGIPVIARVLLLKSVGMARYLNRNVSGAKVPDATIKRLRKAGDKEAESLAIAADLAKALESVCGGVCFVPLGWEGRLPQLLDLL